MAALVVIVASVPFVMGRSGALAFAASVVSLWIMWTTSVFLHELGHALGASLVGLRPFILVVGGGPSIVLREVAGVALDIGILPGDGLTLIAGDEVGPRIKWRLFFTYASGPAVSAALLAFGFVAFPEQWHAFRDGTQAWIGPAAALVLANGLLLFTSIVPLPRSTDVGTPRNDLLQILKLPWQKPRAFENLVKASRAVAVNRFFQLKRYQAAFNEAHRLLAEDPSNWVVRIQLADMLIFSRRYAEAAAEYGFLMDEPAFSAEGVPPLGAALVANNFAWASYMQGKKEAIVLADSASSKAIALAPNNPHVLGTRGAILVALGNLPEGRKLLERAKKLHRDEHSQASNVACLALAAAAEGRIEDARRLLEQALKLDPDCELSSRIETAIAARSD